MNNNVLIIGGGPAGLEAASQLQRLSYNTILIEKTDKLGDILLNGTDYFPQVSLPKRCWTRCYKMLTE